MRACLASAVISLGFAAALGPQAGFTQSDRDFVFTDEDGHLIIRFAGTAGLDPSQIDEISNAEFSRMVHDRLRADLLFQAEPPDPAWSGHMAPQIEQHVAHIGLEFSDVHADCRAATCRVIMEQRVHWPSVPAHRAVLGTVQKSLEAFIAARPQHFERGFMITAYDQARETSHFKAFLRRAGPAAPHGPDGP